MSVANTSQHLQRLKQAHLVVDERDGQFIRYCLPDPLIVQLWIDLRSVAQRQLAGNLCGRLPLVARFGLCHRRTLVGTAGG